MGESPLERAGDACCLVNTTLPFPVWMERRGDEEERFSFHPEHGECYREVFHDEIGERFSCIADTAVFQ
jgi:hypothetical protein